MAYRSFNFSLVKPVGLYDSDFTNILSFLPHQHVAYSVLKMRMELNRDKAIYTHVLDSNLNLVIIICRES